MYYILKKLPIHHHPEIHYHLILNNDLDNIETSFQDGVTSIYDSLVGIGVTPESNSPSDISIAISNITVGKDIVNIKLTFSGSCSAEKDDVTGTAKISGNLILDINTSSFTILMTNSVKLQTTAKSNLDGTSRTSSKTPTINYTFN